MVINRGSPDAVLQIHLMPDNILYLIKVLFLSSKQGRAFSQAFNVQIGVISLNYGK